MTEYSENLGCASMWLIILVVFCSESTAQAAAENRVTKPFMVGRLLEAMGCTPSDEAALKTFVQKYLDLPLGFFLHSFGDLSINMNSIYPIWFPV